MGVFQKIGNALARLMYGRNGVDQLSLAIVVGSLVLDLVSMFVAPIICGWGMRCIWCPSPLGPSPCSASSPGISPSAGAKTSGG